MVNNLSRGRTASDGRGVWNIGKDTQRRVGGSRRGQLRGECVKNVWPPENAAWWPLLMNTRRGASWDDI